MCFAVRALAVCLCVVFFFACKQEEDPAQVAANAAQVYYDHLLQGHYADYVDGTWRPDSIPADYRQQLIDNAKMFASQMKTEHRGMKAVAINHATYDEQSQTANAYLTLTFHNGDVEQILVPMLYRDGLWWMR